MEFGTFPWSEILMNTLGVVTAYFAGRYRDKLKKDQ